MAITTRKLGPGQTRVTFANGTSVESSLGSATVRQAVGRTALADTRAVADEVPLLNLDSGLREVGIREQETIEIELDKVVRSLRSAEDDRVTLNPAPAPDGVQVVLYVDESGGMSWHLPKTRHSNGGTRAASSAPARFTIETRTVAAQRSLAGRPGERGDVTKLGRKIFKVLVVPLSKLLAKPVESIVGKIERKHRQNLIRALTPDNYSSRVAREFTNWSQLGTGKSLLVVHGILSTTEGMLSLLPKEEMAELHRRYEGRVIGFDHLTLTEDPEDNARFFLRKLRQGNGDAHIDFDVLCHSRGGIVSRVLAERGRTLNPSAQCAFQKVYFVATPNAGSPLADSEHMVDMIDVFTNLMTNFPDGPVTYSIEIILAIVKLLVSTAERNLPGLGAMGTKGFIRNLNRSRTPSPAEYASASADYEPDPSRDNGFLAGRFGDAILDRVFERAANDLVVPRDGVFGDNDHPSFPIERKLVFAAADHVWHTGFFAEARALKHIKEFLSERERITVDGTRTGHRVWRAKPPERLDRSASSSRDTRRSALSADPVHRASAAKGRTRRRKLGAGRKSMGRKPPRKAKKLMARAKKPAPTLEAVDVQREPHIDFRELVRASVKNTLTFRLSEILGPIDVARVVIARIPRGKKSIEAVVTVGAPGFDIEPRAGQPISIGRAFDAKRERVVFQLTAHEPGPKPVSKEIRAEIWIDNSCLGAVIHHTTVVPKAYKGPMKGDGRSRSQPFTVGSHTRKGCDLLIYVQARNNSGKPPFSLRLSCEIPGEAYPLTNFGELDIPGGALLKHMQAQFDLFTSQNKNAGGAKATKQWRLGLLATIETLGKDLWSLLPKEFQDEYFRLLGTQNSAPTIMVHSDEMIIPWELIVPYNKNGKTYPPLGVRHVMGRWRPGLKYRPPYQRLEIDRGFIVNPKYPGAKDLPWSYLEAQALKGLLAPLVMSSPQASPEALRAILKRTDVQLLHYSGHGKYNAKNPDLSALELEANQLFPAVNFTGTPLLAKGALLYLNACEVGMSGAHLGRMGGFAAKCILDGSCGVIAPYWSVNDASAKEFSLQLYERIAADIPIGEALRDLRAENRKNPTFQAFTYFGDPMTTARFNTTAVSVAPARRRARRVG